MKGKDHEKLFYIFFYNDLHLCGFNSAGRFLNNRNAQFNNLINEDKQCIEK